MNLSSIITGVPEYLEYAWLVAPNAARQTLARDGTQTTLTLTNEIVDTGNNGSISSNQITLNGGTYYFEARAPINTYEKATIVMLLADVTSTATVLRSQVSFILSTSVGYADISGQFVCANNTKIELRSMVASYDDVFIGTQHPRSYSGDVNFTVATPTIERTTIKLWKLK